MLILCLVGHFISGSIGEIDIDNTDCTISHAQNTDREHGEGKCSCPQLQQSFGSGTDCDEEAITFEEHVRRGNIGDKPPKKGYML